jgi:DNA-binding NarL/FixJ family response regulator
MSTERLRLAVVSASPSWRDGIAALLSEEREIELAGTVATIGELSQLARVPDVVILDAPNDGTIDTLLQNNSPALPFVILTDELDADAAVRLLRIGSVALLEADPPAKHLLAALRAVAGGLSSLSPAHVAPLMHPAANPNSRRSADWIEPLTPRELQILRMLSDGLPNKSIATQLQISEHTAKFHVGHILAKLGAESRTEAVALALRHGLIMV